jgi:hypothetical protein
MFDVTMLSAARSQLKGLLVHQRAERRSVACAF